MQKESTMHLVLRDEPVNAATGAGAASGAGAGAGAAAASASKPDDGSKQAKSS
jgi:hypothetical protein